MTNFDVLHPVMNLVNSNIGVGILAMPYCFHECGILLTPIVLCIAGYITLFSCEAILRSSLYYHCNSFEHCAYKSHGVFCKRLAELSIIGLLFGMLVGFNVTISDMGSEILTTFCGTRPTIFSRHLVLIAVLSLVTPFCLLKRVELISWASTCSVVLYLLFLFHLFVLHGFRQPFLNDAITRVRWWRLEGLVRCLPIIAGSLCCQVQVNVVYASLSDPTPQNMLRSLRYAITCVIAAYALAGFVGYIAFYEGGTSVIAGNLLSMYPNDFSSALMRFVFLFTVAASFPLILFPLRTALGGLLFEERPAPEETLIFPSNSMPNHRFNLITVSVTLMSIFVSQTTDKVEVILNCSGSFAAALICYVLPGFIYLSVFNTKNSDRLLAVLLIIFGIFVFATPIFTFFGVDSNLAFYTNSEISPGFPIFDHVRSREYYNVKNKSLT